MHEFHRVRRLKREEAEQHFIKRDAERIQIRAIIYSAVDAPGLLWRHVRERAFKHIGVARVLRRVRKFRGDAEINQFEGVGFWIPEKIGRVDVQVHDLLAVNIADDAGDSGS